MKNIWSLLCTRALIDQRTNGLSLIDAIDELTVTFNNAEEMSAPTKNIPVAFEFVSLWHDEAKETERKLPYIIVIKSPQGEIVGEFKNEARFEAGKTRLRTLTSINGLKLTVEGKYLFQVSQADGSQSGDGAKEQIVAEVPIDVRFLINLKR